MSALRLLLLSALAASASGYIPTLSGPVRAAEAHERGGLSPFHFKWGRRQRRELGAEGTESSGESGEHGLDEEAKEEIQDWTSTLCLVALALTFVFGHFLESIHFDFLPEAGVGILLGAALAGTTITMLGAVRQDEMVSDEVRRRAARAPARPAPAPVPAPPTLRLPCPALRAPRLTTPHPRSASTPNSSSSG